MSSDLSRRPAGVTVAANNGEIGGGEVMALALASALRARGHDVLVIGPSHRAGVVLEAQTLGFPALGLSPHRADYMRDLRRWSTGSRGLLWCNGLVPALATTGLRDRIVGLHRLPRGPQRAAQRIAGRGALATVVPSQFMARSLPGAIVLENWTPAPPPPQRTSAGHDRSETAHRPSLRLGFLGRWAHEKGLDLLVDATTRLPADAPIELVVAGAPRFHSVADVARIDASFARAKAPIRRLGWVSPDQLFSAIDVLVVPSREPESFGLVAIEAMARGIPVAVTDAGGLAEVVPEGHPWVAVAGDVESLAAVLRRIVATSPDERRALGDAGHARWRERYSPEAGGRRLDHLLSGLGLAIPGRTPPS